MDIDVWVWIESCWISEISQS